MRKTSTETREAILSLGMINEQDAATEIYGNTSGTIQERMRKQAIRVEIPGNGKTDRAWAVLYWKSDIEELKAELAKTAELKQSSAAPPALNQAYIDAIAEAVLARLGGK